MANRWSPDRNIKFVELYKDQANLWHPSDPNYKNRDLREVSLEHIRMELDLKDTNEVRNKIKNLRSTYHQELVKIERSKQSGSGTDEIYKPSIKWFDSMDHIMKIINLKEQQTTSKLESRHSSMSGNDLPEESSQSNYEDVDGSSNSNRTVQMQPMMPPKRLRSKKKLTQKTTEIQVAMNELKELSNSSTMSAPSPREDECDVIGRHVALQLRQLPTIDRLDAIDEIQGILTKYRKKALYAGIVYSPSICSSECSPSP